MGQHAREARPNRLSKVRVGGGTRRPDGRQDPAARARDVGIALTREPAADLLAAVAGPDRVRVRVDETRQESASCRVDRLGRRPIPVLARIVRVRPGESDSVSLDP